jgi:cellulose synthase operon protein C
MIARRCIVIAVAVLLASCRSWDDPNTLASLKHAKVEIRDVQVDEGIDRAMLGYRQFLEVSADSELAPEAMRRLADLKIEKEYGLTTSPQAGARAALGSLEQPERHIAAASAAPVVAGLEDRESEQEFEQRSTLVSVEMMQVDDTDIMPPGGEIDLQSDNALEAIALYQQLLRDYPEYQHNDQVLYQMARAYEEIGEIEEAMEVMNDLAANYPGSRFIDEVQFRRGEYFFTRNRFFDAEDAYSSIAVKGADSAYYEPALYKLGWTLYKQELYEEGLHNFIALLDHKFPPGTGYADITEDLERKRIDDTYRVISFSFSYLGGADEVTEYFATHGQRSYEEDIYSNLGEHYLEKLRYADAAGAYKAFVNLNPLHQSAPRFDMRVIEIYKIGGFPRLVIDANKEFAASYGLQSNYWRHYDPGAHPEVLGYLKDTLRELANHYHAQYQDPELSEERGEHYREALTWYREYLDSFPQDVESPQLNYQLADLLLEHRDFRQAALEYERTAYDYAPHERAAASGYAAVFSWREYQVTKPEGSDAETMREVIRSSIRFADVFPEHEQAALVLGGAADDLFTLKDYEQAETVGRRIMTKFPGSGQEVQRSAALVVAHSTFELGKYAEAEQAYEHVLRLTGHEDESRAGLYENLAASIYKQGEMALAEEDYQIASNHFLRIAQHAPDSTIRPTAEFDGAVALIRLEDWDRAAEVLQTFRTDYPGHELQPEVTKRIAHVYKEAGKLELAAAEYERIETESDNDEIRRSALLFASELYEEAGHTRDALRVYERLAVQFPHPVEQALEARARMAEIYKEAGNRSDHHTQLRLIVAGDAAAGDERTGRTRYLAATSALVLSEPYYEQFSEVSLVMPFEQNLAKKQAAMRAALDRFGQLTSYQVAEVTAAATFYMAEIYYDFSHALMTSERPADIDAMELEEYELALEEQAFPFEEMAISVHEKNLELMSIGVYNRWIEQSIAKLADLMPARYARTEEGGDYIESIGSYLYEFVRQPAEEPVASEEA